MRNGEGAGPAVAVTWLDSVFEFQEATGCPSSLSLTVNSGAKTIDAQVRGLSSSTLGEHSQEVLVYTGLVV